MKTKLEIIEEIAHYYSKDTSRRSVVRDFDYITKCAYKSPSGNVCAVGYMMTKEALNDWGDYDADVHELFEEIGTEVLRSEYRGHPGSFYKSLQMFHDNDKYWDENGLTAEGQFQLAYLKEKYGSN